MAEVIAVFDRAGLDGEDGDAFAVHAVAKAAKEGGEAGLGGSVDVVGFPATVSGDGAEITARTPAWRWTQ